MILPPREKYRKATFAVLGLLLACSVGCDQGQPAAAPSVLAQRKVVVTTVTKGAIEHVIEVPVSIEGYQMTSLVSKLEAYVGEVKVDIGQEVSKGDLLATLEVPELLAEHTRRLKMLTMNEKSCESASADMETSAAEVEQAKARLAEQEAMLKLRESELERVKGLVKSRVIVKERLNEAQYALDSVLASVTRINADVAANEAAARGKAAQRESALAEVEVSRAELQKVEAQSEYLKIRAPYDGLITERLVHPGAFVLPAGNGGAPLLSIEDVETMKAVMFVAISDAASIDLKDNVVIHDLVGLPSDLTIPANPKDRQLTVSRFANSLNRASRMMRVEVDLKNAKNLKTGQRLLKPGGYGKARLTLNQYTDIALVPDASVVDAKYVVSINDKSVCQFIPVKVMVSTGGISGVIPDQGSLAGKTIIVNETVSFKDGEDLSSASISNPNN